MANPQDPVGTLSPLKRALLALDDMKARLDAMERSKSEPIAVIGIGCRFPGAGDPQAYWTLLRDGVDAVTEVPKSRWDADAYYNEDPNVQGTAYGRWGGFVDNVDRFDPQFFGIAPREAAGIDPQQRLLLEVTWEALEHAALSPERLAGSATGVFVGICSIDYAALQLNMYDFSRIDAYSMSGNAHSIAAGRLSYILGLQGPAMAVDTACSSSLVSIHLACQSLRNDECRTAVAAGVHVVVSPLNSISFSRLRMLAADGRCKTFDAAGDGFVEGEGCGVVVLKRLSDAVADGDRVLAVVRGSAINQDGASSSLTAPNGPSQESVIRAALQRGGVAPADVSYVEAHGTGTTLGDPIEVQALASVLGEGRAADTPLMIGSVKTNIGHTQGAAGIAGFIKLVLALQHEEIPPTLHFNTPNPYIPWNDIPVRVATARTPWQRGERRRIAGVSSFGFSGTNAHVVLEDAPAAPRETRQHDRPVHVLTVSGRTEAAMRSVAGTLATRLAEGVDLADAAFSANAGRSHFTHRLAIVAATAEDAIAQLQAASQGDPLPRSARMQVCGPDRPRVAFLFTGQGSQYAGMGRELYETQPVFRAALDRCDAALQPQLGESILRVMYPPSGSDPRLDQTMFAQPAIFSLEYALAELWKSWGVVPSAVMGHSIGEYVAACLAGVFSVEDALTLVAARGRLMQSLPSGGAMAAVFAPEADVKRAIADTKAGVSVAAVNGIENVVVSGPDAAVTALLARLESDGVGAERLVVSHAFHSSLMDPILDEFERVAASIALSPARMTLVSNLTGRTARHELASPGYWRRHLRESVLFLEGVRTLHAAGFRVFLESGPTSTLCSFGKRAGLEGAEWLPSLRKGAADTRQLLESVAAAYTLGVAIDWNGFDKDFDRRKVTLGTYPFERQRCWSIVAPEDGAESPARRRAGRTGGHPLLGSRLASALADVQFQSEISTASPAFLIDHQKNHVPIYPATAYLEMGFAAAREAMGDGPFEFEDLAIVEPLILGGEMTTVQVILTPAGGGRFSFRLFSADGDAAAGGTWKAHATGTIGKASTSDPSATLDAARAACTQPMDVPAYYARLDGKGHQYGPAFQAIAALWRADGEAFARLELPASIAADAGKYRMHPVLLDAALQMIDAGVPEASADADAGTWIPASMGRVRVLQPGASAGWAHMRLRPSGEAEDTVLIDTTVFDDNGGVLAQVDEMALRRMSADAMKAEAGNRAASWMHEVEWRAKPRAEGSPAEPVKGTVWILLGEHDGAAAALAGRLDAAGARSVRVIAGKAYQAGDGEIRIDPSDPSHFIQLLADVRRLTGRRPHAVVDFWTMTADPAGTSGDALLERLHLGTGSVLHAAQALAADDQPARLWIVTAGAAAAAPRGTGLSVAQAPVFGLARSISVEHPELRATCIDLDPAAIGDSVSLMWQDLAAPDAEDLIAFRSGTRHVARLVRSPLATPARMPAGPVSLEIGAKGMLDKLELRPIARTPPGPGEVELRVTAAGLNFRDVLNALGMYEGPAGPLGAECVGVVTSVGDGVRHLAVGDTALGMAVGSLRSYVNAPADTMIVKPAALSDSEAATIPITFLTAEYALNRLARMKKGERVLIHAGAGGVGLAAIQIAQRAGAEVYATAGSAEKHAYLHSIGVRHVLSSRSLDFADDIQKLTSGEGVDIVLNSLTGDFISRSVAILRRGGRFLEIGRAGIWTKDQMRAARPDITYFPIYLGEPDVKPAEIQALLRDLMPAFASGELRPLRHQVFAFADASPAFRHMAAARHIGKIVFDVAGETGPARLKADATYLVTGGLGALGIRVARWMADAGAKTIVLTGRSAPSERARTAIADLTNDGVDVVIAAADVSRAEDVDRLIGGLAGRPPLAGIVHAAGVIDDGVLLQQNWSRFAKVFGPKVLGAWHLHTRTLDQPLDFFVTFSSMVTVVGAPGQGNYAAANAFLDALAHHRRAIGKPGLTINWGPWADSGMAAGVDEREQRRWKSQGVTLIQPEEGLAAMARLLSHRHAPAQVAVLPLDWSVVLHRFAAGEEPPFVADLAAALSRGKQTTVAAPRSKLLPELAAAAPHLRRGLALSRLRAEAVTLLGLGQGAKVDAVQPLRELGLDSLMSVELRNAIAELLDRKLPATFLFKYPTLDALTDFVVSLVADAPGPAAESAESPSETSSEPVSDLSDEEARKLLMEELDTLSAEWISEKN